MGGSNRHPIADPWSVFFNQSDLHLTFGLVPTLMMNAPNRTKPATCSCVSRAPTLQFAYQPPFGATLQDTGVQFSVFSRSATELCDYCFTTKVNDREPAEIIEFDRDSDRWGDVWSLDGSRNRRRDQLYHFQA